MGDEFNQPGSSMASKLFEILKKIFKLLTTPRLTLQNGLPAFFISLFYYIFLISLVLSFFEIGSSGSGDNSLKSVTDRAERDMMKSCEERGYKNCGDYVRGVLCCRRPKIEPHMRVVPTQN
jgi:hypothetical protein